MATQILEIGDLRVKTSSTVHQQNSDGKVIDNDPFGLNITPNLTRFSDQNHMNLDGVYVLDAVTCGCMSPHALGYPQKQV